MSYLNAASAGAGVKRGRGDSDDDDFDGAWGLPQPPPAKPTPEQRLAAKKAAIDRGFGIGDLSGLAGCCGDEEDEGDDDDDDSVAVVEDSPAASPALTPFTPAPWPYPTAARPDAVLENPAHPAAVHYKLVIVCDLFGEGAPPVGGGGGGGPPRAFAPGPPPHLTTLYWTDRRQGAQITGRQVAALKAAMLKRDRQRFLVVQTTEGAPAGVVDPSGALACARREMVAAVNSVDVGDGSSGSSSSSGSSVSGRHTFHSTDSSARRSEEENVARVHCTAGLRTPPRPVAELLAQYAGGGKGGSGKGGSGSGLATDWALAAAAGGAVGWVFTTHFTLSTLAAPLRVNEPLFHALRWLDDNNAAAGRVARANVPLAVPAMPPYVGGGGGGGGSGGAGSSSSSSGSASSVAATTSSLSSAAAAPPAGRPPVCPKGVRGIGPDTQAVITHALRRLHEGRPLFIAPSYG